MMQVLKSLRDFMTEDALKMLPGSLHAQTCMLLKENMVDKEVINGKTVSTNFRVVLHVFDETGTFVGTIEKPHFVPK